MHLKEVAWPFLLAVLVWRNVSKYDRVQRVVHSRGSLLACLAQWYTCLMLSISLVLVWTLLEIFWTYRSMDEGDIKQHLRSIWKSNHTSFSAAQGHTAEEFERSLHVPTWVMRLNLISQLACVPTFVVAADHSRKIVMSGVQLRLLSKEERTRSLPWKPSQTVNTILFVISMPTVFSIMALRSTCRIWALITGIAEGLPDEDWGQVKMREFGRYRGDVELATAFQFFTVVSFARLTGQYLRESAVFQNALNKKKRDKELAEIAEEYRQTISIPAFLGVYSFCAVGVVRCIVHMLVAECQAYYPDLEGMVMKLSALVLSSMDSLFIGLTILCVLNMFFICRMQDVKRHLGNANLKFSATRLLLIITQVQLQIITAFLIGTDMYYQTRDKKQMLTDLVNSAHVPLNFVQWNLTEYSARLLHTSLLGLECLAIVIFNRIEWGIDVQQFQLDSESARDDGDDFYEHVAEEEPLSAGEEPPSLLDGLLCSCTRTPPKGSGAADKPAGSGYRRMRQLHT